MSADERLDVRATLALMRGGTLNLDQKLVLLARLDLQDAADYEEQLARACIHRRAHLQAAASNRRRSAAIITRILACIDDDNDDDDYLLDEYEANEDEYKAILAMEARA